MKFKVGDRVVVRTIPKWYAGAIKLNESCIVSSRGCTSEIIWVRCANGERVLPIYESWAVILKNQQLLFAFMD